MKLDPYLTLVVQSLSRVRLFVTPWTEACQASLSFTICQNLLRLRPTELMMPSNHLILFSPDLSLSQHQSLFQQVGSSHQVAKVLELQPQHQSFQWIFRVDFLYDWLAWFSCFPRDFQESSPAPQFESIISLALSLLYSPTSHLYMTAGKTLALTTWTFVAKVMSLLFNTLSRFVIAFLWSKFHGCSHDPQWFWSPRK